jgi:aspartate/methionine/tyrosine aminotransferase
VVVTVGASGGVALTFLAAFEPGDRVAVPAPGYPCYRNMLHAFGVEAVPIRCGPETRFQPTPELLDAAGPLHGVVVASPSNPTGTMLPPEDLAALVAWCDDRGARLVSDEIYHGITFDRPATTALAASDRVVVVNSFSKYFSMTGWRIGWMVVPEDLAVPVERLAQNLFIAAPTLSQHAAVAAFDCHDELRALVDRYAVNRRILLDGLTTAGFDRLAPADGAFYVYAAVDHLTGHHPADDAQALCATWLRELGVAATPGIDFDPFEGGHHVRFSFAGDPATMTEAVSRLATWSSQALQQPNRRAPHR